MSNKFKLTSYYPSYGLSPIGREFMDEILGAVFDETADEVVLSTYLEFDVAVGDNTITLNDVSGILPGDRIFISNQKYTKIYTQYTTASGTINVLDAQEEHWEQNVVESVSGNVVTLQNPLRNASTRYNKVRVHLRQDVKNYIILETIDPLTYDIHLDGNQLITSNILNTYMISSGVYEIPVTSTLFPHEPDIDSIVIEYIDRRYPTWIQMVKNIDYEYVIGSPDIIRITNTTQDPVTHPQTITNPEIAVLKISYNRKHQTDRLINVPDLQTRLSKGKYFRNDGNVVFDQNNQWVSGIPQASETLMSMPNTIMRWYSVDRSENREILEHIAYLLGISNKLDIIPLSLPQLIQSARDIFSAKGSKDLIIKIGMLLGLTSIHVYEEWGIVSSKGSRQYEKFYAGQPYIPSYRAVKQLWGYEDTSSSVTKTNSAGWGSSGFLTSDTISSSLNESFQFVVANYQRAQIGLTTSSSYGYGANEVQYGVDLRNNNGVGELRIIQNGSTLGSVDYQYKISNVIRLSVENSYLKIYINDVQLTHGGSPYQIALPTGNYHLGCSLQSVNASFVDVQKIDVNGITWDVSFQHQSNIKIGFPILKKNLLKYYTTSDFDLEQVYTYYVDRAAGNDFTNPEGLDQPYWTKNNITLTQDSNETIAPGLPSWKITTDPVIAKHSFSVDVVLPNINRRVMSIYAKADSITTITFHAVRADDYVSSSTTFNLTSGTVVSTKGTLFVNAGMNQLDNGWFRLWMEFDPAIAKTFTFEYEIGVGGAADFNSSMWVWGPGLYEFQLQPFLTKYFDFNNAFQTTIETLLHENIVDESVVFPLSTFTVTAKAVNPFLQDPQIHFPQIIEEIRPFSRLPSEVIVQIVKLFRLIDIGVEILPFPMLYDTLNDTTEPIIGNGVGITFTRPSTAWYWNFNAGKLVSATDNTIIYERISDDHNLLLYSEEFNNSSTWTTTEFKIDPNTNHDPSGLIHADRFVVSPIYSKHSIEQSVTLTAGVTYTFSIYMRQTSGDDLIQMNVWKSNAECGYIGVNASLGTIPKIGGGYTHNIYQSSEIISIGTNTGWYRVRLTVRPSTSGTFKLIINTVPSTMISRSPISYISSSYHEFFLWGAQLSKSSGFKRYVRTRGSVVTSFDGVLVNRSATNYIAYSNDASQDKYWTALSGATITPNATSSPKGGDSEAMRVHFPNSGSSIRQYIPTINSGGYYTTSVWLRSTVSNTSIHLRAPDRTLHKLNVGTSWKRFHVTSYITSPNQNNGNLVEVELVDMTGGHDVYVWGFQINNGAGPSLPIPNTLTSWNSINAATLKLPADGNIPDNVNDATISFLVVPAEVQGSQPLFRVRESFQEVWIVNGEIEYRNNGNVITSGSNIQDHTAIHVAVVQNANNVTIYVDGVELGTGGVNPIAVPTWNRTDIFFNDTFYSMNFGFKTTIDFGNADFVIADVRTYDIPLTSTQIAMLYDINTVSNVTYRKQVYDTSAGLVPVANYTWNQTNVFMNNTTATFNLQ